MACSILFHRTSNGSGALRSPTLDQGRVTSAEAVVNGGMHTSQGDTWEMGADVMAAGTAGLGRATGRHISTGGERKTEGRRLCPISVTPPPPSPPTEDGGLPAV